MAELKRSLGFGVLLALSVTSILGTGLFFGPAIAAGISGNSSIFAWIILSLVSLYIAACFGELVSMFPKAGGIYEFAKQTYGRFISFLVGWTGFLIGTLATTLAIVGAVAYLLPEQVPGNIKIILTLGFIIFLNVITYIGIEASSIMVITFTIITISLLAAVIIPGFFLVRLSNFSPLFTHPFSAIFLTIFFIAETFFGYEASASLAEETKNPEKVIPKAIIWGTVIVAAGAILLTLVLLGTYGWQNLAKMQSPLSEISIKLFGPFGDYIGGIGIYLVLLGSAAAGITSSPRLLFALSRDKLFLPQFAKIHPKFHTPANAIIFQTIISLIVVFLAFGRYQTLLSLVVPTGIILYVAVLLTIPILRYKKPELKRAFKVPFGKIGPIIASIFFIGVVVGWLVLEKNSLSLLIISISFIALGIPLYFLMRMYHDAEMHRIWDDILAYIVFFTERVSLPISIRRQIISMMGNLKDKVVLEFGCSVGTLTLHLAEEVGPNGKVYATDISKRELLIAHRRIHRRGHNHVTIIHDEKHSHRVHPDIPNIHSIVSAGALGYLQDIDGVLGDMNKRLKKGSKICFVEYDKFFGLIPNAAWLSEDDKIKNIFRRNGFAVSVMRKQGFAWKYIFVYGTKVMDS